MLSTFKTNLVTVFFGGGRRAGKTARFPVTLATTMARYVQESCDFLEDPDLLAACIDWLDCVDSDPDLEVEEDCCQAYDDYGGKTISPESLGIRGECGSDDDAEVSDEGSCEAEDEWAAHGRQSSSLGRHGSLHGLVFKGSDRCKIYSVWELRR